MSSIDDFKQHLNLVDDTDDALLARLLAASEASVTNDIAADPAVTYDTAPADLQLAILMKAAHFYENREAVLVGVTAQALPLGYAELISSYRKFVF